MSRARNWCFTDNERKTDWLKIYNDNEKIRYLCFGVEKAPTTLKVHNQGWLQFIETKRLAACKKLCATAHWEPCRGDEKANDIYCKKEGIFFTYGKWKTQGKRTDIESFRELSRVSKTTLEVANADFGNYCKYHKAVDKYRFMVAKQKARKQRNINVIIIWGDTGVGKTSWAWENYPELFPMHASNMKWWDGYDGEEVILIDEYSNQTKLPRLLGLLDKFMLKLQTKGGHCWALWHTVIITSNLKYPDDWHIHAREVHKRALARRVTKVIHMERDDDEKDQNSFTYSD